MVNETNIKTASEGVWGGDNPLNCAFPLLIVQVTMVLFSSRFLALLLKPLRQPKVVAEILGGILLGPSALGRNEEFVKLVFPTWSRPILESVASIGLLFFLFLVGLELDLAVLSRTGKKAFAISIAGISLPFVLGAGISLFLSRAVEDKHDSAQFIPFIINLVESFATTSNGSIKVYVMHLMELTDRSSSISMVQRTRRNGVPFIDRLCKGRSRDGVEDAFSIYGQVRDQKQRIKICHLKSVSGLGTMHEDICNVAERKKVWMILVPNMVRGWSVVNQKVMEKAKCVVVSIFNGGEDGESSSSSTSGGAGLKRVGLVFIGGVNDRKALEIGSRMAQHHKIIVTLLRFSDKTITSPCCEKDLDELAVEEFKKQCEGVVVEYEDIVFDGDLVEIMEIIGTRKEYELMIIGDQQVTSYHEMGRVLVSTLVVKGYNNENDTSKTIV